MIIGTEKRYAEQEILAQARATFAPLSCDPLWSRDHDRPGFLIRDETGRRGVRFAPMSGLKMLGFAALAAAAIVWGSAAEASTLSFNLQSADYNYSWTMDSDPTVALVNDGSLTSTTEYTGQAIGSSAALPAGGLLYFFPATFEGGIIFQDTATFNFLFDFTGDQIYSNGETAPHFSPGIFAFFYDFVGNRPYTATLTIAATPIPAALPLFASALGGLGFIGWKRRKSALRLRLARSVRGRGSVGATRGKMPPRQPKES
jgi:hypothetical protein